MYLYLRYVYDYHKKYIYISCYFKVNYNNIRKTWDGIKSIINISNMKSMSPSSLNVNNKINTNPVDNANCFNDYFSNV